MHKTSDKQPSRTIMLIRGASQVEILTEGRRPFARASKQHRNRKTYRRQEFKSYEG